MGGREGEMSRWRSSASEGRHARSTQAEHNASNIYLDIYTNALKNYVPVAPSCLVCLAAEAEAAVVVVMMRSMLVAMRRGMGERRMELRQHFLDRCGCSVTMLRLVMVPE